MARARTAIRSLTAPSKSHGSSRNGATTRGSCRLIGKRRQGPSGRLIRMCCQPFCICCSSRYPLNCLGRHWGCASRRNPLAMSKLCFPLFTLVGLRRPDCERRTVFFSDRCNHHLTPRQIGKSTTVVFGFGARRTTRRPRHKLFHGERRSRTSATSRSNRLRRRPYKRCTSWVMSEPRWTRELTLCSRGNATGNCRRRSAAKNSSKNSWTAFGPTANADSMQHCKLWETYCARTRRIRRPDSSTPKSLWIWQPPKATCSWLAKPPRNSSIYCSDALSFKVLELFSPKHTHLLETLTRVLRSRTCCCNKHPTMLATKNCLERSTYKRIPPTASSPTISTTRHAAINSCSTPWLDNQTTLDFETPFRAGSDHSRVDRQLLTGSKNRASASLSSIQELPNVDALPARHTGLEEPPMLRRREVRAVFLEHPQVNS